MQREDAHAHPREGQVWQQLWRQQEALRCAWCTAGSCKLTEHCTLICGVHALIDLVHNTEWRGSNALVEY